MAVITDVGLEWSSDNDLGKQSDEIDTIAVGSDGSNESISNTSLESEEYRQQKSASIVEFNETSPKGEFEGQIDITGGTEVPAGTTIAELGFIAGGGGGSDTLIFRDTFSGVTIDSGDTVRFIAVQDYDQI